MSYLSRRMREEGFWRKKKPGVLTFNLTVDTSRLEAAFERASRAMNVLGERAGLRLTRWQEWWLEAAYADPDALHRMTVPPVAGRRWPPVIVAATPDESNDLAGLVAKVREAGQGTSPAWEWPDEALEYWPRQNGKSMRLNREYLGVWPTSRERE